MVRIRDVNLLVKVRIVMLWLISNCKHCQKMHGFSKEHFGPCHKSNFDTQYLDILIKISR